MTKDLFDATPKILLLGKTQNGKSSFLIHMSDPERVAEV
jgi:hypothetical protein